MATPALLFQPDCFLGQITGDLLDVAANIAHFGELGCLNLDERRVSKLCQTAADFRLAATGGSDHQYILWCNFVAKIGSEPLTSPAVTKGDRDRALGVGLADDMLVESRDYRFGCQ